MQFSNRPVAQAIVASVAALLLVSIVWADPQKIEPPRTVLIDDDAGVQMRAKLNRSKQILEGIVRRDFDAVSRAAGELKRIGDATDWPLEGDATFDRYQTEFAIQCEELDQLAKDANPQGVQFTFLVMTATCIRCHDHVRDALGPKRSGRDGDTRLFPSRSQLPLFDHRAMPQ